MQLQIDLGKMHVKIACLEKEKIRLENERNRSDTDKRKDQQKLNLMMLVYTAKHFLVRAEYDLLEFKSKKFGFIPRSNNTARMQSFTMNDNKFEQFWSHVEERHHEEYNEIIERCQSMTPCYRRIHSVSPCLRSIPWTRYHMIPSYISLSLPTLLSHLSFLPL